MMCECRGFSNRVTVQQATRWIDDSTNPLPAETVGLDQLAGRVLADVVVSQADVPGFDRAMMDGFAVVASDTEGASPYNPMALTVVGDILPGAGHDAPLLPGSSCPHHDRGAGASGS